MADSLVLRVKEIQRSDPAGKMAWWKYADKEGGQVRDPAKHTADFLQWFISQYDAGAHGGSTAEDSSDAGSLADLIKEGQRTSSSFKEAWALYVRKKGLQLKDPTKHAKGTLIGFLDWLGQQAMGESSSGFGDPQAFLQSMMVMMSGKGMGKHSLDSGFGPPNKRQNVSTGDAKKDALVKKIKDFQRSGEDQKQAWWAFCDAQPQGNRDPARYEVNELQLFCTGYGF